MNHDRPNEISFSLISLNKLNNTYTEAERVHVRTIDRDRELNAELFCSMSLFSLIIIPDILISISIDISGLEALDRLLKHPFCFLSAVQYYHNPHVADRG